MLRSSILGSMRVANTYLSGCVSPVFSRRLSSPFRLQPKLRVVDIVATPPPPRLVKAAAANGGSTDRKNGASLAPVQPAAATFESLGLSPELVKWPDLLLVPLSPREHAGR